MKPRRPAELDDRDRRGLTALPHTSWRCLVCGEPAPCQCTMPTPVRLMLAQMRQHPGHILEDYMPAPAPVRFARLRALGAWIRFALLTLAALVGVILAAYALHGDLTWN